MAHPVLHDVLRALRERTAADYRKQLAPAVGRRGGFTAKQLGDFEAGFRDGQASLVHHLIAMGVIRIVEVEPQTDESGERTERAERRATEPTEKG